MGKVLVGVFLIGAVGLGFWLSLGADMQTSDEARDMAASIMNQYGTSPASQAQVAAVSAPDTTQNIISNENIMQATLHTNQGDIVIEFFGNDAPNTVANFIKLAQEGYYNGTKFHRVIKGFMIQGGDPLTKDDSMAARWGTGGPGYQFADEIHVNNRNEIGTIAMANAGPGTNGSQFFINVAPNNFLDSKHTVFGKVTVGMDVVAKIEGVQTAAGDRPVEPMTIQSISVQ